MSRGSAMLVTIGVDDLDAITRCGARAIIDMHLAVGEVAQCFCLAAAQCDLTARPYRAYAEKTVNLLMDHPHRTLLQVLIGKECRENIAFPLGAVAG